MFTTRWFQIVLGSIALHLGALSLLTNSTQENSTGSVYLATVELSFENPVRPQPPLQSPIPSAVAESNTLSGSTQAFESTPHETKAFSYLRESISRALNKNLRSRPAKSEVIVNLKFSETGEVEKLNLGKSSGLSQLDSEVLEILNRVKLYSSPQLANLRIQIPVKLQ